MPCIAERRTHLMSEQRYRLAVFIGRFQPFHCGHRAVLHGLADNVDSVLALVGSAYRPRSWKNPFLFQERADFIRAGIDDLDIDLDILPLVDTLYNDRSWAANVRSAVSMTCRARGLDPADVDVILTGFEKDKSSRYLSWFPEWTMHPAEPVTHKGKIINATDFREAVFGEYEYDETDLANAFGTPAVESFTAWEKANPDAWNAVATEGDFMRRYRNKTKEAEEIFGHPIPINTVDAVVIQSGHVLLVERGKEPGIGTLALPGGHIEASEMAIDAALRELREETRLDMPKGAMAGRLRDRRVFDHPERSERGWVRTEAFYFELQDRSRMEEVKGGDDAKRAFWKPISEITPDQMFEDHFDILQSFVPDVATSYTSILMAHAAQIGRK